MDLGLCEAFELTCIEYLFHFAGSLGLLLLCSMKGLFERNEDKYRNHIATCNLLKAAQSADWPFLPLVHLYHQASDAPSGLPPADAVGTAMRALQWVLVLESWRPQALWAVPPAARLARLMCVFLVDSELFREIPIQRLVAALLAQLCQPEVLPKLNLDCPLPGLASFPDLYANFLEHFEAVSFGDHLFGVLVLLPLQRRFSVTLRLALFGEHVGALRALGLPLSQVLFHPAEPTTGIPYWASGAVVSSGELWRASSSLFYLLEASRRLNGSLIRLPGM